MARIFSLPDFQFDRENETEWAAAVHQGVEYNISRPYEPGTLHDWDESVPPNCNFGISLGFINVTSENERAKLVKNVGERIAKETEIAVHYHRTWLGTGENVTRNKTYE